MTLLDRSRLRLLVAAKASAHRVRRFVPAKLRSRMGRLLGRVLAPNPIRVKGLTLWCHSESLDGPRSRMLFGDSAPATTGCLNSLLKPGMGFVDVGAYIGYYTLIGARAVGSTGRVWSFEPMPSSYALLRQNVGVNGAEDRVESHPMAVSKTCGQARLFPHQLLSRSSLVQRDGMRAEMSFVVQVTSLDEFFATRGWPRVDLVKIEVEGAELDVIEGMPELIRRNPGLAVVVEVYTTVAKTARVSVSGFLDRLRRVGLNHFVVLDVGRVLRTTADVEWLVAHAARVRNVDLLCRQEPPA